MGMDAISWGMLGTSAAKGYLQYQAGREAEKVYKSEAQEVANQTAYAQRVAIEQMKDLNREGRSERSAAIAAGGKSGLAVGGSVVTLTQAIAAKVERRKALIGMEFNEQARRNAFEIKQLKYKGKRARLTGQTEAFGSLLTGGLAAAKYLKDRGPLTKTITHNGVTYDDSKRRTSDAYKYYR